MSLTAAFGRVSTAFSTIPSLEFARRSWSSLILSLRANVFPSSRKAFAFAVFTASSADRTFASNSVVRAAVIFAFSASKWFSRLLLKMEYKRPFDFRSSRISASESCFFETETQGSRSLPFSLLLVSPSP